MKLDPLRRRRILGYANKLTVRPGDTIEFKICSKGGVAYEAQLVRLVNGDVHSERAGFKEVGIGSSVNGVYDGREQATILGSCVIVDSLSETELRDFTLAVHILPTTPSNGLQHLVSRWNDVVKEGWSLQINEQAQLAFSTTDSNGTTSSVALPKALLPGVWYAVVARVSWHRSTISLSCRTLTSGAPASEEIDETRLVRISGNYPDKSCPVMMAASFGGVSPTGHVITAHNFNGRLEDPALYRGWLSSQDAHEVLLGRRPASLQHCCIAEWDFARSIDSTLIIDRSPNGNNGYTFNLPLRGVKGSRWKGTTMEWKSAPDQYAAVHFHCDDLYDCGWATDINYQVPTDAKSGVYAIRLRRRRAGKADLDVDLDEDYVTFFIAPPKGKGHADIVFIVPTYTYLAYGNFRAAEVTRKSMGASAEEYYGASILGPGAKEYSLLVDQHPEVGSSLYDCHIDGSPVHFSSWLRPLLNMRPKSVLWTLCADLLLIDWLEGKGLEYDVITDDLLQSEGAELLSTYRVCITGNHPEYQTTKQLDAMESYIAQGGRLMYLGGNGYYWRVAVCESLTGVIEVRRGRIGSGLWQSDVGEGCLAFSGEVGGIWRELGRPPQRILGVGFIAQGLGASCYRTTPEARRGRASFALEGVEGEVIGDFGVFGAAAGQEIDRTNPEYGTPPDTVVLARSEHGPGMVYAIEEMRSADPFIDHYRQLTSAEIAIFETPNGGAVFSVGSMAWCGSLGHNQFENNVSKITENVLKKFLS